MPKRKRDDVPETDPAPVPLRQSSRQRKKRSYGEEFEESWSPPRGGNGDPTPQQPAHTSAKPGSSTDPDPTDPDPIDSPDTITYPSDEEHWKKSLLAKHRKCLYFYRKCIWHLRKGL